MKRDTLLCKEVRHLKPWWWEMSAKGEEPDADLNVQHDTLMLRKDKTLVQDARVEMGYPDAERDTKHNTSMCKRDEKWVVDVRNHVLTSMCWETTNVKPCDVEETKHGARNEKQDTLMCREVTNVTPWCVYKNGTAWCETRWETWYLGVQSDEKPDPGMWMRNGTILRAHIMMCKEMRNVIVDIQRGEKRNSWMHKRTEKWDNLMCEQVRRHTSMFFTWTI